ncbi:RelA/SpoT domain protein [Treponema primitia ZAS-2]|uniref:RelA/SpoT domain protein n=1 Tax=Treponema primitia (strain ATCC BAA-887 / DSM 12427 / ZAS-2) TaxID=545694 RepID=F5YH46_TREPZ|nr:tetratricopeptide repeat protein [Treponema primitia]AEF86267.1 RelA/SpoT domain protein [Treponema primitia ZAS-2]
MNNRKLPDQQALQIRYEGYSEARLAIAKELQELIEHSVQELPSPLMVKVRSKDFVSFFKKYIRILNSGSPELIGKDGSPRITDIIGVRIICPFLEEIDMVELILARVFEIVEVEKKGANYSFKEFGYESIHILVKIPASLIEKHGACGCDVAEVQIRTILQNAWAEVEHELVYKAEFNPFGEPMKRKLAAINANLFLADVIFEEIRTYQRQLNGELGKRRHSFFKKVEDATDALLFNPEEPEEPEERLDGLPMEFILGTKENSSMDDLLLEALSAHNKSQFNEAIYFYSRILEMNPDNSVRALVYKHRGMANFARSHYEEALKDFSNSLKLDQTSYKSAYYRGLVRAVLQQYSEAIEDFTLSVQINPYQHFCLCRRGQAYYHLGDYPQALADCEAALVLDPSSQTALQFRDLLREKLKM